MYGMIVVVHILEKYTNCISNGVITGVNFEIRSTEISEKLGYHTL
jgi:hypothetical protein